MAEMKVNGMPVFRAAGFAQGWMRTSSPADALEALRGLSLWFERVFALPLDHQAIDLLQFIGHEPRPPDGFTVDEIRLATGLSAGAIEARLGTLAGLGFVQWRGSCLHATPALLQACEAFDERLDHAFIARHALRQALLLNTTRHASIAAHVEQVFDRFFDLGWLYLHNWGANCYLMARLVAEALARAGHRTRIVPARMEIARDDHIFVVGGAAVGPGQVDGHAVCVVDDAVLVDFGLGVARRHFRRDLFWGMATDLDRESPSLASTRHPRAGAMRWVAQPLPRQGEEQLRATQQLALELMLVYPRQPLTLNLAGASPRQGTTLPTATR